MNYTHIICEYATRTLETIQARKIFFPIHKHWMTIVQRIVKTIGNRVSTDPDDYRGNEISFEFVYLAGVNKRV